MNTNHTTTTTGSTGSGAGGTGQSIGQDIKNAVKGVHGVGESIRGNINTAVDSAFDDRQGEAKNKAVAQKGENEMSHADAGLK